MRGHAAPAALHTRIHPPDTVGGEPHGVHARDQIEQRVLRQPLAVAAEHELVGAPPVLLSAGPGLHDDDARLRLEPGRRTRLRACVAVAAGVWTLHYVFERDRGS